MGVLNATPDSFSDGGRFESPVSAVDHGLALWDRGAAIIDVGGESTRPGADRVDASVELRRVLPIVRGLASSGVVVSVDTTRASVARRCIDAGASMINDVSGGIADPAMAAVVADSGVGWVLGHWRGEAREMDRAAVYSDVVPEVRRELGNRVEAALNAGVSPSALVLDPGLGFSKIGAQNWEVLANLDAVMGLGFPVMVGASRKRFLASVLRDGERRPATDRDAATAAVTFAVAAAGAWGVRVHDVGSSVEAIAVLVRLRGGGATR